MKTIFNPRVYLVGRQMSLNGSNGMQGFLHDHGVPGWESDSDRPAEILTETAGRLCYMSFSNPRPGGNEAYLHHIKESGHGSVLEHAVFNLIVTGVSRSLTHELVRHRAGMGFSQLSQRYVDEGVAEYVAPPDLQEEVRCALLQWSLNSTPAPDMPALRAKYPAEYAIWLASVLRFEEAAAIGRLWLDTVEQSHAAYVKLGNHLAEKARRVLGEAATKTERRKFARQAARSVLPNATETKVFVTVNGRAARNIIEQRASSAADPEIRLLAVEMWRVLNAEAPNLFGDYTQVEAGDGSTALTTQFRKV